MIQFIQGEKVYMNLLIGVIFVLLGISLIGTILQNEMSIWKNSQNMFIGCVGGIISYYLGFTMVHIIVITIICIVISFCTFKLLISAEIFNVKNKKIQNMIIGIAIIFILIGILYMSGINVKTLKERPIMWIMPIFLIFCFIIGYRNFVNFIPKFNPDNYKEGETIYIIQSFFNRTNLSIENFDNKKIYVLDMNSIIGKNYSVIKQNDNFSYKYYININGIYYNIKEKNNNYLEEGNIVKISRVNIDKGIIREGDVIIVEKR